MSNRFNLEQRRLFNMYLRQYEQLVQQYQQTNIHLETLRNMLNDVRTSMNLIIEPERRQNNNNRHIYYDYNRPINRELYINDFLHNIRNSPNNIESAPILNNLNGENAETILGNNRTRPLSRPVTLSDPNFIENFISGFERGFNSQMNQMLSDVIVRPTQQQIDNASRLVSYRDISSPLSESCPITLEHFNPDDDVMQIHHCGHIFSLNAFNQWFERNVRCPVCRYDIRNYRPNRRRQFSSVHFDNETSVHVSDVDSDSDSDNNTTSSPANTTSSPANTTSSPANTTSSPDNTTSSPANTTSSPANTNQTISNVSIVRNNESNEVDSISFDIEDNSLPGDLITNITTRLLQGILNTNTGNINERFAYDPSNNILLFESIFRANSNTNNNNTNNNNTNNNTNNNNTNNNNTNNNNISNSNTR
jgi:hypothetical protein